MSRLVPSLTHAVAAACLVLAGAACTPEEPSEERDPPVTASPTVVARVGAYVYADPAGIGAELTTGTEGTTTLTVENATGDVLARPGVYVLDARDGHRVTWTVVDARPVPDGETVVFSIERPAVPEDKHIGLAALLFGGEDHGAFVPPVSAEVAA